MRIFPCYGCPLKVGCKEHEGFQKRAAGTGAVSIRFRCQKLISELRPGRKVVITAPSYAYGGYSDESWVCIGNYEVRATITAAKAYKFVCTVDPGELDPEQCKEDGDIDAYRFRRTIPHHRIVRFLDEPDLRICKGGCVVRDGWHDSKDQPCQCQEMQDLQRSWEKALA